MNPPRQIHNNIYSIMKSTPLFLSAIFSILSLNAFAQAPAVSQPSQSSQPVYAVLSLIGDKLDIVVRELQIGSKLDKNSHDLVAIEDPVFDQTAIRATANALLTLDAKAEVAALNTRNKTLFDQQRDLFAESGGRIAIPEAIKGAMKAEQATHLILITKHTDLVEIKHANLWDGAGKLTGLGFYLDGSIQLRSNVDGKISNGFIAPFAFFKMTLVDPSSQILGQKFVKASIPIGAARSKVSNSDQWGALSGKEKVAVINDLITDEITKAIPELMLKK